jgi:hypothetical protein
MGEQRNDQSAHTNCLLFLASDATSSFRNDLSKQVLARYRSSSRFLTDRLEIKANNNGATEVTP